MTQRKLHRNASSPLTAYHEGEDLTLSLDIDEPRWTPTRLPSNGYDPAPDFPTDPVRDHGYRSRIMRRSRHSSPRTIGLGQYQHFVGYQTLLTNCLTCAPVRYSRVMTTRPDPKRSGAWGADLPVTEEEARERLLVAAESCFVKQGPSRTRMSDIAREAGVHRSTLYYYFPNQNTVLVAVACSPWMRPAGFRVL